MKIVIGSELEKWSVSEERTINGASNKTFKIIERKHKEMK